MTRFYCILTAILTSGCTHIQDEAVNHEDTPPATTCVEPANPPEPIEIRFVMRADGFFSAKQFTDACGRFAKLGLTCTEVATPAEADVAIVAFSEYNSCRRNADILQLTEDGVEILGIAPYLNCMPEEGRSEWVREVFVNQLGVLFGIDGTPRFFGEGSFNFAVNQGGFTGPYHTELSESDIVAWAYRWQPGATFGPKNAVRYCGPPIDPLPADCAALPPPEKLYTVKVWASPGVKEFAAAGCKLWAPVGVTCEFRDSPETADIHVSEIPADFASQAGFTYYDGVTGKWVVYIRLSDQNLNLLTAHELGHAFGLQHVPWWIAKTIMGISFGDIACMTEGDYLNWLERDAHSVIP